MIEYIRPDDPDDRVLQKACDSLAEGKIISFPTESTWVLAVGAGSKSWVKSLLKLGEANAEIIPHILCQNLSEIGQTVHLVNEQFKMINHDGAGAYINVFNRPKGLRRELAGLKEQSSIGVKWVKPLWCQKLVDMYDGTIFCLPLTNNMIEEEVSNSEIYSFLIEENLGKLVPLIIDPGEFELTGKDEIRDFTA